LTSLWQHEKKNALAFVECFRGNVRGPCNGHFEPESVLQEADRITDSQRRDKYGPPAVDFAKVQGMAKALWGRGPENEAEHSLYMVFVKLAREQHAHQRDNIVDAIGYLKLYHELRSQE
jgi:hypothetical protein